MGLPLPLLLLLRAATAAGLLDGGELVVSRAAWGIEAGLLVGGACGFDKAGPWSSRNRTPLLDDGAVLVAVDGALVSRTVREMKGNGSSQLLLGFDKGPSSSRNRTRLRNDGAVLLVAVEDGALVSRTVREMARGWLGWSLSSSLTLRGSSQHDDDDLVVVGGKNGDSVALAVLAGRSQEEENVSDDTEEEDSEENDESSSSSLRLLVETSQSSSSFSSSSPCTPPRRRSRMVDGPLSLFLCCCWE
mmetsp:Transcript_10086/g.22102  ORF Transcript_10086/g.22102 Transcript_10086/m.22102 type:complete len:246 (+) Transcript_10086:544-1281(+)